MAKGEQIDRLSKMYVKLSARCKAYAKRMHKRHMRKVAKDTENDSPMYNRYSGWIG